MTATRRDFLGGSLVTLAAAAGDAQAADAPQPTLMGGDLLSRMTWLNAPVSENYAEGTLSVRARGKTDFWRKTFYGYVTDNGHFMSLPVKGEFKFTARVLGNYASLYDQSGLMVRLDERHWMKCGTEFFDDRRWASVVFTHDFSDWSTMEDLSQNGAVWWRVERRKDSIEAKCSKDGDRFVTVRQGYFPAGVGVNVGVMLAAPAGPGFDATFDQLLLERA
jgi:regulation of enolase protein 1 (concanavalin A-like superfamily)